MADQPKLPRDLKKDLRQACAELALLQRQFTEQTRIRKKALVILAVGVVFIGLHFTLDAKILGFLAHLIVWVGGAAVLFGAFCIWGSGQRQGDISDQQAAQSEQFRDRDLRIRPDGALVYVLDEGGEARTPGLDPMNNHNYGRGPD